MAKHLRSAIVWVALSSGLLLAACSPAAAPAEPTIDPNTIYTQAVLTVQAGLSQTAAARPTDTSTPAPTSTPEPSSTPVPPSPSPTSGTPLPTLPGASTQGVTQPTTAGAKPLSTTAALGQTGEHAAFGSQGPADNSHFNGLQETTVFWSLVNTGTTTWTKDYKLVWFGGRQLSGQVSIPLEKETKPGQKGEFYTKLIAPDQKGTFTSFWHLVNAGGQVVPGSEVYLKWIVP